MHWRYDLILHWIGRAINDMIIPPYTMSALNASSSSLLIFDVEQTRKKESKRLKNANQGSSIASFTWNLSKKIAQRANSTDILEYLRKEALISRVIVNRSLPCLSLYLSFTRSVTHIYFLSFFHLILSGGAGVRFRFISSALFHNSAKINERLIDVAQSAELSGRVEAATDRKSVSREINLLNDTRF